MALGSAGSRAVLGPLRGPETGGLALDEAIDAYLRLGASWAT